MARPINVRDAKARLMQAGSDLERSRSTLLMLAAGGGLLLTIKPMRRLIVPALALALRAIRALSGER